LEHGGIIFLYKISYSAGSDDEISENAAFERIYQRCQRRRLGMKVAGQRFRSLKKMKN
jgi:hypothetical protein